MTRHNDHSWIPFSLTDFCPMNTRLPLRWYTTFDPDSFCTSPSNHEAYTWLQQDPRTWPYRHAWLSGPQGCGKTHLASIWAINHEAQWWTPSSLDHSDMSPYAVIDWGRACPETVDQSHLFQFLRQADEMDVRCLWLSRYTPGQWTSPRPDVVSRVRAMIHVAIEPPDDELLRHVLHKMLQDDGWKWPQRWVTLVLQRMVRSCQGVALLIQYLREHMAGGKSFTSDHDVLVAIEWVENRIQHIESESATVTKVDSSDVTLG